jgi:hypothetical protein
MAGEFLDLIWREAPARAPNLEFVNIFNAGTIHRGAHFLIFLFLPFYMLFLAIFSQNWNLQP